jgi:hypothetical protein
VTAFFLPGIGGDQRGIEDAYDKLRTTIELELGCLPRAQRIFRLWSRRGSVDCLTEVGRPDPLRGGTVIAIFDMCQPARVSNGLRVRKSCIMCVRRSRRRTRWPVTRTLTSRTR